MSQKHSLHDYPTDLNKCDWKGKQKMCAEYKYLCLTKQFMCVFTNYTSERLKGILLEQLSTQASQAGWPPHQQFTQCTKIFTKELSSVKPNVTDLPLLIKHCQKTRWLSPWMSSYGSNIQIISIYSETWSWKSNIIHSMYRKLNAEKS